MAHGFTDAEVLSVNRLVFIHRTLDFRLCGLFERSTQAIEAIPANTASWFQLCDIDFMPVGAVLSFKHPPLCENTVLSQE